MPGPTKTSPSKGLAVLEMEDVLEGGDADHQEAPAIIATQVDFSKSRCVYDHDECAPFKGRRWYQNAKYNFRYNMIEYLWDRLEPM